MSALAWPPLVVQCAFTTAPLSSSPSWTDITEYTRAISIRRGRDFELARNPTGTATLLLDNRDRRFDPTYASSPYYPYVMPGRRIRVSVGTNNLATNPSLETNSTSWGHINGDASHTESRDSTHAFMGTWAYRITSTSANVNQFGTTGLPTLAASTTYTASIYAYAETAEVVYGQFAWLNSIFSWRDNIGASVTLAPGVWRRLSVTATTDATGTNSSASIRVGLVGPGTGNPVWIDAAQLEVGSIATIYNDTVAYLYDGYVESWPQEWQPPNEARSPLEAADGFKLLNLANLPGGYPKLVLGGSPVGYWRLGETSGTTADDSSTTGNDGTYTPSHPGNATGALTGDSDMGVDLNGTTEYVAIPDNAALAPTSQVSVEAWIWTTSSSSMLVFDRRTTGNVGGYLLTLNDGAVGNARFYVYTSSYTSTATSGVTLNDGAWHHVVATYDGANLRIYCDSVLRAGPTALTGSINAPASTVTRIGAAVVGSAFFTGTIDEVAIYSTALSASSVAAHYSAGRGSFPSQTSMQRYTAVLDAIGWPSGQRVTYGGLESVQATTLSSATAALQHLQDVADSEAGRLFMDASGNVRFDGRDSFFLPPYTDTTGSFSDNALSTEELGYYDLKTKYDDSQIWNDVRLTRTGGTEQIANDVTSITNYGLRTMRQTGLLNTSDTNVLSLAQYRRNQYKDPQLRFTLMTLRPGVDAQLWQQVIQRDIGDRVRIGRTPQRIGPAIGHDCWIEGVEHDIRPGFWETRWKLSRADAQTYWILGDATYGLLGSTTYLAF